MLRIMTPGRGYPRWIGSAVAITIIGSWLIMLTNNGDYNRDADVMFWWLIGTVVGLSVLSIVLHHHEEGQEGKARSVSLFFAFESLISLIGAWKTITAYAASGKPWF